MKNYTKLIPFGVEPDILSTEISSYNFNILFFSHWISHKTITLSNLIVPYIKIIMITKGNITCSINSITYNLFENDILIIPPYTIHSGKVNDTQSEIFEIFFNVDALYKEIELIKIFNLSTPTYLENAITSSFSAFIKSTHDSFKTKDTGYYINLDFIIRNILLKINKYKKTNSPMTKNHNSELLIANKLIKFLEDNISKSISVNDCTDYLTVSQSYLYRVVKNIFNQSINQLINNHKMIYAKRFLQERTYNITEISEQLGYSSLYYFSRVFKQVYSVSPSEYVKDIEEYKQ
jgi:AraC-like DNA-binding protein